MKILFITDLYPIKTGESNSVRTLHNFVIEWIKEGHQVDVIKPNFLFNSFLRKKPFYKTGFYEFEGVKIFNVNYFTPFLFDVTTKLPNVFENYDVIVAHMPSGIIFADKLAKKFNKPLICGVHCSDIAVLTKPVYRFYFKTALERAYRNAKRIACRSFVLQKKFKELLPEFADKTFVAASGVDIAPITIPFTLSSSPFTLLTCANLIPRKNIDKLILAVKDLEDFELKIIGDGVELKRLKKIASSKITFLGKLPQEKVFEEMQKANVFILPSVSETFGMVYLEAMACGCVTVCTKNDGIDGIIKDGENGFLCEPTIEGIKRVLLKIKNHEDLYSVAQKGLETAEIYTPQACAANYFKYII